MRLGWMILVALGCAGNDDDDDDGDLYAGCDAPTDCDAPADADEHVEPACLDKGDEGFCTVTCAVDEDCADADLVCASFESEPETYCFPSCADDEGSCPPGFGCRSTGGGSSNRKVCFPE